jgi:four helix bundle protein
MDKIVSFRDLNAWQEGHKLALMVYKITKTFPREETFCLVSQMRRSAVSITSNIAEGFSRQFYKEKIQFYFIAQGSVTELQNQLMICRDVNYLSRCVFREVANQTVAVHKLVNGLIKKSKIIIHDS